MINTFAAIANRFNLSLIILFGSRASKRTGTMSDVDILVHSHRDISLTEESDMKVSFAMEFDVPEERIDLVFLKRANGLLRMEALHKGEMLFGDPLEMSRQQIRAGRLYGTKNSL